VRIVDRMLSWLCASGHAWTTGWVCEPGSLAGAVPRASDRVPRVAWAQAACRRKVLYADTMMHAAAVRNVSRPKSRMDELDDDVLWAIIVYRAGAWRCWNFDRVVYDHARRVRDLPAARLDVSCGLRVQRAHDDRARRRGCNWRSMASRALVCDRGNNDIWSLHRSGHHGPYDQWWGRVFP